MAHWGNSFLFSDLYHAVEPLTVVMSSPPPPPPQHIHTHIFSMGNQNLFINANLIIMLVIDQL